MKIIVMGAGIIGVTSAYFLAKSGHEVIVIDKNPTSSLGCSYANGCQLSYSHIEPWASKSAIRELFRSTLFDSFISINKLYDKDFLKWGFEFLKNCRQEKFLANSKKIFSLSQASKEALEKLLKDEPNLKFDYKQDGILHFFKNSKTFDESLKYADFQQKLGIKLQILNANDCVKREQTLVKMHDDKKLLGGIFYEDDASGNSLLFTKALEKICQEKYGVVFEYNTEIKNILTNYKKITGINTNKSVFTGDKYVCALGAYGNKLLKGVKINSKIYPIKGHSLSIESDFNDFIAPTNALTDNENKIVYSRVGNIFRAAGCAEIDDMRAVKNKSQINFIKSKIKSSFSDCGNLRNVQEWFGFRPFRPNSIPLIGEVKRYGNLYLNFGHGHLGWTLSCGSAQILTQIIEGKNSDKFEFLKKELETI